jgi:hypothetical protein
MKLKAVFAAAWELNVPVSPQETHTSDDQLSAGEIEFANSRMTN